MITPRLYLWGSIVIAILLGIGAIYAKGRIDSAHKAEVARLEADVAAAARIIEAERQARLQDAIIATENAKRKAALETKIGELDTYVETLEDRNRECLSGADTERLRQLWQEGPPADLPDPSR